MKTKLIVILFIVFTTVLKAQQTQKSFEDTQQDLSIKSSRLSSLEKSLKAEQKLLSNTKGNSALTSDILAKIKTYTSERDEIILSIQTLKESEINKLSTQETAINSDIAKLKTENSTIGLSEKKNALKIIKDNMDSLNEVATKTDGNKTNIVKLTNNEAKYMFLNGFNFDMNSIDKLKYVGHFNIYIPATQTNNWGIYTGLLKVNYLNNDSLVEKRIDKVLKNPLDVLLVDSSYNKQYNQYSRLTESSSYSAYFQVLRRLFHKGTATVYLHGHSELLISNYTTTTRIKTISEVSTKILTSNNIPTQEEIIPLLTKNNVQKNTFYSGYFGVGFTLDMGFSDNCSLFFQATTGYTIKHPNNNPDLDPKGTSSFEVNPKPGTFYLVRSYFQYHTSTSSQIVLGTDIRHIPGQVPFVSIYAGLNLGIDKIADLFKEK